MSYRLALERRTATPIALRILTPVAAVACGLASGAFIILVSGQDVSATFVAMWQASFGSVSGLESTAVQATPLVFTGLAVSVALKMGLWNIGAEGQIVMGAVGAMFMGLYWSSLPRFPLILMMFLAGMIAAAVWAAIAALPRAFIALNEVITTLFLNYVALQFMDLMIYGPWRDPSIVSYAFSRPIPSRTQLPMLGGTGISLGLLIAVVLVPAMWWLFARTRWGFGVRMAGGNERIRKYFRLTSRRDMVLVLMLSGAIAGLAGVVQLLGITGRLQDGISGGYGYTGILVAFLAGRRFGPVVPVAALFAALTSGGFALQASGVSSSIASVIQGSTIVFALVVSTFGSFRLRLRRVPRGGVRSVHASVAEGGL